MENGNVKIKKFNPWFKSKINLRVYLQSKTYTYDSIK